jgi:hypothetical protein
MLRQPAYAASVDAIGSADVEAGTRAKHDISNEDKPLIGENFPLDGRQKALISTSALGKVYSWKKVEDSSFTSYRV